MNYINEELNLYESGNDESDKSDKSDVENIEI